MKKIGLIIFAVFTISVMCHAQFGADYSSYGFNFVKDVHNEGLNNWTGSNTDDADKFHFYKQDDLNNYALELRPVNEILSIDYNDSGYMDLNPCSFNVLVRVKINEYSGNTDTLKFVLFTGAKKVQLEFTSDGISYRNSANNSELITPPAAVGQWVTYTLALDNCNESATLMLENDATNRYTLDLPDNTSAQNIGIAASTNGANMFSSEIDHLFIYSNPVKWWLAPSEGFRDDTPSGYVGTTGDRQHFLSLPNGERIGVNENGGGYVTFTELTPGGPNLDPFPKFGSGGTKTLRGYFHTSKFNPVQAGISSTSGGHLASVISLPNKLSIESFPLHSYFQDDFIENSPIVFPSNVILNDESHPVIIDDDVYDEFGLDMRHELMSELDFNSSIENVTRPNSISTVKHAAEWEYIRHPSHILQFHEVDERDRPKFEGREGADTDMGDLRFKFEFRLNKDLGYEWIFWRDANNEWQSFNTIAVGDKKEIVIDVDSPPEQRFMVFSTSPDPNDPGAVSWFYPESNTNVNSTVGKSRANKEAMYTTDRRTSITIIADWRKTNWCRMNLYVRNDGLKAPCNGDANIYESFQFEALQLFGSPNEILAEVLNYDLDNDGFATYEECDDNNVMVNPNQVEVIYDGVDNDCDPLTLDDDLDQDGFINAEDCDDENAFINPGTVEIPYDGIDNDCNPLTLDDDLDQDGFVNAEDCDDENGQVNSNQTEVIYDGIDNDCNPLTLDDDLDQDGFVNAEDCDDENALINPGTGEIPYDGIDNDCNPLTLDDDLDQDGFVNADDCDDENVLVNSDMEEVPYDGVDNDCDPQTLDDDLDQDGFINAEDCDDENALVNSDMEEVPYDGVDNDCSPLTLDDDLDQDGFINAEDCDDENALVNPDADEIPSNGLDEDCDGEDLVLTSIRKFESIEVNIYPNPAGAIVNIDVIGVENIESTLYNLLGDKMKVSANPNKLLLTEIPSGVYLLQIMDLDTDAITIKRLVVAK